MLRGQGGLPEAPAPSLADRLGRLAGPAPRRPVSDEETARLLAGHCVAEGLILVERTLPLATRHGSQPLSDLREAPLALLAGGAPVDDGGLLFLDTETTGLAGGTGTLPFLLGLARIEGEALRLRQYFLTGFKGEPALLEQALPWYRQARHLVSFNGKRFDLPLLATRYRLARRAEPFGALGHIDLLYPTRRAFARNWPDCRLQTAERRLLGFVRSDDLPGHLVPQAWFDFVRLGAADRLPAILLHNRWDLVSLVSLAAALARLFARPRHGEADLLAIARAHRRNGDPQQAYRQLREAGDRLAADGLLELAALHRRNGEWEAAAKIWQRLAEAGSAEALERLAKYQEHVRRDYRAALALTRRLLERHGATPAHLRRQARLTGKLAG